MDLVINRFRDKNKNPLMVLLSEIKPNYSMIRTI